MFTRLPTGWSEKPHSCELPFVVFFTPKLGDVWTCPKCLREWQVDIIQERDLNSYGRYELEFYSRTGDDVKYVRKS